MNKNIFTANNTKPLINFIILANVICKNFKNKSF